MIFNAVRYASMAFSWAACRSSTLVAAMASLAKTAPIWRSGCGSLLYTWYASSYAARAFAASPDWEYMTPLLNARTQAS